MKKIFSKIHLWLSIPFGLIITLVCFSGAMLVFEKEIMEWSCHDLFYVEKVGSTPLSLEQLVPVVEVTLPGDVKITGVNIFSDSTRTYQMNLSKPRRASIYVDQYIGKVKGRYERAPFFTFMLRMHRWLLDSVKPDGGIFAGKMVVGISVLMFVFILMSGVVIWWPRTRKALKNSTRIFVHKGWRTFWYSLHVTGGMYVCVFLLVMALTGLTWSFPWYRTAFYKIFGAHSEQVVSHDHKNGKMGRGDHKCSGDHECSGNHLVKTEGFGQNDSGIASWQKVYEQLKRENHNYKQITVAAGSASVSFNGWGNQRAYDRYMFNSGNGEITKKVLYEDWSREEKIRGWIYSVHIGSWGGWLTRILAFFACLIGVSLPLTGYYFWIRKWYVRRKS